MAYTTPRIYMKAVAFCTRISVPPASVCGMYVMIAKLIINARALKNSKKKNAQLALGALALEYGLCDNRHPYLAFCVYWGASIE